MLGPAYPHVRRECTKDFLWVDGPLIPSCLLHHQAQDVKAFESTAFVALLRACAKNKDFCRGSQLHDDILKMGLLEKCSDALVTMYAKCGCLAKARELFDTYKCSNPFTWTALISGYAHMGLGHDALHHFDRMQLEGLSPDAATFTCILKACGTIGAALKGEQIHEEIAKQGLLRTNIVLGNALVNMYAKCRALTKARQVLEELPLRNAISWNTLISGYAQHGQGEEALNCFEQMQCEGLSPDVVTFVCIFKACGSIGAVDKGEKIHNEVAKKGLLGKDSVLDTALVDMYAKCGALAKARQVLEKLPAQNVIPWNALIARYAQKAEGAQALNCFEAMQRKGLSPNAVTFACVLKACSSIGAIGKGEKIHDEIVEQGLLADNIVLGTAVVDMYAKCGALAKARQVHEGLLVRDVISWNALIAGYVRQEEAREALDCFEMMQREGFSPDVVTFVSVLKACGSIKAVEKGETIHEEIAKQGLLGNDAAVGAAIVDMYATCGVLAKAQQVLEQLKVRNVHSWSALILGYAEHDQYEQVLNCFEGMGREGLFPDKVALICVLKACGNMGMRGKGEEIHDEIAKQGLLGKDVVVGTALVDMYAKCGALAKARRVLEELPYRDVVSWSALIAGYNQKGEGEQALNCFEQMQHEGLSPNAVTFTCVMKACGSIGAIDKGEQIHDQIAKQGLLLKNVTVGNAVVDMYAKCGALAKAQQVFKELPVRDANSWSVLIVGYVEHNESEQALKCVEEMRIEGLSPNVVTFACALKACGNLRSADKGEEIHNEIAKQGLLRNNIVLCNSLVDMYAKCGALVKARRVLEELPVRNVISWNALIAGYMQHEESEQALGCFEQMRREGIFPDDVTFICILKACGAIGVVDRGEIIHNEIKKQGLLANNIVLSTALVDMYAKCGALAQAQRVLENFPVRDVISWNALITGYVQQGEGVRALKCFELMERDGLTPNAVTFICILKACGSIGAVDKGEKFYDKIIDRGLLANDIVLGTALVDMYAKCGALAKARQVLGELHARNAISWNALIAGYVQQGEGEQALNCLEEMQREGLSPDTGTFSCILNACSRFGRVDDAQMYFMKMSTKFGMKPNIQHYTCMVDLFGRAGHLDKAVGMIEKIPSTDRGVWSALLGACRKWGDVNVARWAFKGALQAAEKMDAAVFVTDNFEAVRLQEEPGSIAAMRRENKAWKESTHTMWSGMSGDASSVYEDTMCAQSNHIDVKKEDLVHKMLQGHSSVLHSICQKKIATVCKDCLFARS